MGEIINTKTSPDKITYKIELNIKKALQLKNHMKNIHMFSANLCNNDTRIIERGNKKGAKYFVIPLILKSRKKKRFNRVSYQKIETDEKVFYICTVNKDLLF